MTVTRNDSNATTSVIEQSAVEIASAVRSGSLSSRDVVEAHIHVLQRARHLNALARARFDLARDEADAADRRVAAADDATTLPPLLGVPMTVKELVAVEGMPHSGGFVHRRNYLAVEDAPAVASLREAGAIVLGIGNSAGPYYWIETFNLLYGRTNNAHDPSRTAGGSSGGDAVAVAAGGVPIAVGSDLGGSVRIPAFFNGIFGHLPTPGLIPLTGHFPTLEGNFGTMLSLGPLTRRAEDLYPMLQIMAGASTATQPSLGDPAQVSLQGLTVALSRGTSVHQSISDAQLRAGAALAEAGARVSEVSLDRLRNALTYFVAEAISSMEIGAVVRNISERPGHGRYDPLSLALAAPAIVAGLADSAPARFVRTRTARRLTDSARRAADQIAETIGDGVLLHPPFIRTAPAHHSTHGQPWLAANTMAFNVLGMPTTEVPLGRADDGLPLGIQVAAVPGNDHVTIRVAHELESACGGWVRPDWLGTT